MIGRLWRPPQPKQVIIYRLLLAGTEVALSNLALAKGAMHDAFVGASSLGKSLYLTIL